MSLSLYNVEDELQALLDTEEMTEGDGRLAILDEIAKTNDAALAKRDNVARFLKLLDYRLDEVDSEIARLQALKKHWSSGKDRFCQYVISVIEKFAPVPRRGPKKLEGNTSVLSIPKNPPSVTITQESAVPMEYRNVVVKLTGKEYQALLERLQAKDMMQEAFLLAANSDAVPSKALIKDALQNDEEVPGAELSQGLRLEVR